MDVQEWSILLLDFPEKLNRKVEPLWLVIEVLGFQNFFFSNLFSVNLSQIEINIAPSELTSEADVFIQEAAGTALPLILKRLIQMKQEG